MGQYVVILHAVKGPNQQVKPPAVNDRSWVANFSHFLAVLYQQVTGEALAVYAVSDLDRQHASKIKEAPLLFALATSDLQGHPDLIRLADGFLTQHQREMLVGNKYRFVKLMRRPAPVGDLFPNHRHIPSYRFYDFDRLTRSHREFLHFSQAETSRAYWLKLMDITQNVFSVFRSGSQGKGTGAEVPIEKTVFLADVADDMVYYRDALRREMEQRGYRVLPQVVRLSQMDLEKGTVEDLRRSSVSVHLVGENYGRLVEQKKRSIVEHENEIAHKHLQNVLKHNSTGGKRVDFHRLIWLKPESRHFDERQKVFVEHLRNEAATAGGSEVLEADLQELKSTIFSKLSSFGQKKEAVQTLDDKERALQGKSTIYLMHDARDKEEIANIAGLLVDGGLVVLSLPDNDNPHELREGHQKNLSRCDASLIYLRRGSPNWLNTKLQDVMKAPAFGRHKPMRASAVLLDSTLAAYKDLDEYVTVIRPKNGVFTKDAMRSFIAKMK